MSQLFIPAGCVTADLELKTSANNNCYVRFDLVENIWVSGTMQPQYLQVWAWGENAKNLIKSKLKKNSLIWVSGALILEEYKKRDGTTTDKRLKVKLDNWGYIYTGKPKNGKIDDDMTSGDEAVTHNPLDTIPGGMIDGDRETLP